VLTFAEAVQHERRARGFVYLSPVTDLCGIRVRHMTPRDLALLEQHGNPFLYGGAGDFADAAQFIGVLREDKADLQDTLAVLLTLELQAVADEIGEYVTLTFMDAPTGGANDSTPIASGAAWMEYRFACEPFRWDCERTMATPLRRLYQLVRCWRKDSGEIVANSLSGGINAEHLAQTQAALASGALTKEDLVREQMRSALSKDGTPASEAEIERLMEEYRANEKAAAKRRADLIPTARQEVIHEVLPPESEEDNG